MSAQISTLTISEALTRNESMLYVLNRATPESVVILVVQSRDNPEGYTVRVPVSWVPVDLSSQCPREDLLRSPQFRRLVEAEILSILDSAECERLFEKDSLAATERRRLLTGQQQEAAASSGKVTLNAPTPASPQAEESSAPEEKTVSSRLRTWVQSVNEGTTPVEQAVAAISSMSLNAAERQFVLSTAKPQEVRVAISKKG